MSDDDKRDWFSILVAAALLAVMVVVAGLAFREVFP